jgi:hypothetical protein
VIRVFVSFIEPKEEKKVVQKYQKKSEERKNITRKTYSPIHAIQHDVSVSSIRPKESKSEREEKNLILHSLRWP